MSIEAGKRIKASHIPAPQVYNLTQSASLTCTTTFQDVAGLSQLITVLYDNAYVHVVVDFDFDVTAAIGAGGLAAGQILVDGVAQTGQADLHANIVNRGTTSTSWAGQIATASTITIKAQGRKTINAGTVAVNTQSKMTLVVIDQDVS